MLSGMERPGPRAIDLTSRKFTMALQAQWVKLGILEE